MSDILLQALHTLLQINYMQPNELWSIISI